VHRRILHAVSYYVKRSLHKRSLIKLFTQGKLSTPVIFSLRHFGHLFHRIKTHRNSIHQQARNQLVTPRGEEFSERGQIFHTMSNRFELCPKHFSREVNTFIGGASSTCHPWLRTCSL